MRSPSAMLRINSAKHLLLLAIFAAPAALSQETLNIASKRFTESYILGEIVTQTARRADETPVFHKPGLGNT
ncbi:MAG: glycine betaine ABC transporter substrate-binding protein, partial [Burkholderiales bacterium]